MFVLQKIFSREKSLSYFQMWNDSDRLGWKHFLDHDVSHNLFIVPPVGQKGTVWYSEKELMKIEELLKNMLLSDADLVKQFVETLETNWKIIEPYLTDALQIETAEQFEHYYTHLVQWWSAMNTVFGVPDMDDIDEDTKNTFLNFRTQSEKYTEKMNKLMTSFWQQQFPEHVDLTFFVTPKEIIKLCQTKDEKLLATLKERTNGCVMIDGKVYPLVELDTRFAEKGLMLEEINLEDVSEIKGTPAYKGFVKGAVKKIYSFDDMKDFKAGEVLVTEMTNPDYIPIMKQAAAVITDEGGATCHARRASRELQVPCIVGTKIATYVLQDDDEVEVDADAGVVKILK